MDTEDDHSKQSESETDDIETQKFYVRTTIHTLSDYRPRFESLAQSIAMLKRTLH